MRLKNPSAPNGGDHGGSTPEIVEQILGAAPTVASKRSRPSSTSSLDYKSHRRDKLATTKPGKRKHQHQQKIPPEQQQQQQVYRRVEPSRARGNSGPPPRKFDLSDLEGMSEDQMLQAFYEDPDLAHEAAQAAELKQKDIPTEPPAGVKQSRERYYRSADGSAKDVSEYPSHLREMMDGGVPVTQWIVLLVLFGAGLYQLRTILGSSKKKTLGAAATAKKGAEKVGKGKQKQVKKKAENSKKVDVLKETVKDFVEKKTTRSMPEVRKAAVPAKKAATSGKKQAPKKKKKAMANNKNEATKKEEKQQPDLVSTDGSSGAHQDEGESDKAATASVNLPIHTESKDDGGGWQTVSKSGAAALQEETTEVKVEYVSAHEDSMPELVQEEPTELDEEAPMELVSEVKEDNGKSQPTHGSSDAKVETEAPVEEKAAGTSASNNSKKKKKNKIKSAQKTPVEEPTPATGIDSVSSTESDGAFALLLQKEEENLARARNETEIVEVVWEEVATKKKKGK